MAQLKLLTESGTSEKGATLVPFSSPVSMWKFPNTEKVLTESKGLINENELSPDTMFVDLPVTSLNVKNANRRTYTPEDMRRACQVAKSPGGAIYDRTSGSTFSEHPAGVRPTPNDYSHLVVDAWVDEEGKYLWNRWQILDTLNGKNLAGCIKGRAAFGISIRGLGDETSNGTVFNYQFLGTDGVADPSARLMVIPENANNAKKESVLKTENNKGSNIMSNFTDKKEAIDFIDAKVKTVKESKANLFDTYKCFESVENYLTSVDFASKKETAEVWNHWESTKNRLSEEFIGVSKDGRIKEFDSVEDAAKNSDVVVNKNPDTGEETVITTKMESNVIAKIWNSLTRQLQENSKLKAVNRSLRESVNRKEESLTQRIISVNSRNSSLNESNILLQNKLKKESTKAAAFRKVAQNLAESVIFHNTKSPALLETARTLARKIVVLESTKNIKTEARVTLKNKEKYNPVAEVIQPMHDTTSTSELPMDQSDTFADQRVVVENSVKNVSKKALKAHQRYI